MIAEYSERVLLGGILLSETLPEFITNILIPQDFGASLHERIYGIIYYFNRNRLCFKVDELFELDEFFNGQQDYILNLMHECPSTKNMIAHAKVIREASIARALKDIIIRIDNEE